ncbi:hypothetical protein B0H11DRAFT_1925968 [Mycena galericulata]|nr:hypothetical protein B0H11DRAFT_1925968 [Mycena galericulata]
MYLTYLFLGDLEVAVSRLEETQIIVRVFGNEDGDMGKKIGAHRLSLHVHQRRTRNVDPFVVEKPDRVRHNRRRHVGGTVVVRGRKWGGGGQHVAAPEPTARQRWRILKEESAASGSRGGTSDQCPSLVYPLDPAIQDFAAPRPEATGCALTATVNQSRKDHELTLSNEELWNGSRVIKGRHNYVQSQETVRIVRNFQMV